MNKIYFKEEDVKKIIEEYSMKLNSVMNIAKLFSVDGSVIKRILNENNIEVINGSAFSKNYWIKRGLSKKDATLKTLKMKPCCVEHWLSKGFTIDEARLQVELHLMNTERAFIIKYGDDGIELFKKRALKNGEENSQRSKKYWTKRGFTDDDANKKISEVQKTFSKEVWIEKFGNENGIKKLNERNDKWQKTLKLKKDYNEIQKRKDAKSVDHYLNRYGEDYIKEFIERQSHFNEEIKEVLIYFLKEKNYIEFLELIKKTYTYNSIKINSISNLKIIQFVFNKSKDDLKTDLVKQYPIRNKNSWGTTYMIDGIIFRSLGEVTIYNFLKSKNINFKYSKEYPKQLNKKYKCDFYLINNDIYIEYMGMENIRKTERTKKIHDDYDTRIRDKRKHCVENNLKHYFSNSVDDIIKFINNLYE